MRLHLTILMVLVIFSAFGFVGRSWAQVPPSNTPSTGPNACIQGDTNHDGRISLADFETWRRIFRTQ